MSDDPKKRAQAIQHLYTHDFPKIRTFICKNSGTESDAEDAFQEGLVIFYENVCRGKFNGNSKVETYLFAVCKNIWLQELRKQHRGGDLSDGLELIVNPDDSVDLNDLLLAQVFDELKEDCQKVLIEYYYRNKGISELRELLNMASDQVVKNKKGRCLKYLLNLMKRKNLSKRSFFE